jgi:predicted ribosome quality control (RQC) complex YloA/Tae2 family protein
MSNVIRYDSLLVRYLATELDELLRGRRLIGLALDSERRRAVLECEGVALSWNLHPMAGWIVPGRLELTPEVVLLARRSRVIGVRAPVDERVVVFELAAAARQPGRPVRIVVELMGNQWNLIAVGPDERIVATLWRRRAGGRELRPGQPYLPAPPSGRRGTIAPLDADAWHALFAEIPPADRAKLLIAEVAYTSPLNAAAILGEAGLGEAGLGEAGLGEAGLGEAGREGEGGNGSDTGRGGLRRSPESMAAGGDTNCSPSGANRDNSIGTSSGSGTAASDEGAPTTHPELPLSAAYRRYLALASLPPASPRVLELAAGRQPYPLPLPGIPALPSPTLLSAMVAVAGEVAGPGAAAGAAGVEPIPLELLDRLRQRIRGLERRRERLVAELEDARTGAQVYRQQADLLMTQLHQLRKGLAEAELSDWEGGTIVVALDPALGPSENAQALYERARKAARAAEGVPPLLERVAGEVDTLRELLEQAERGAVAAEQVRSALPAPAAAPTGPGRAAVAPPPYRRYRTTGGLEVRVGRSSRANDDLTFRHSAPNDIWLHARDAAGAHVILRWGDASSNPPARDLAEAAVLASLHSRARTSGMVAVDWTRRKYVRKPRKSGPGRVAIERARTIFVEPDAEVERRLRGGD